MYGHRAIVFTMEAAISLLLFVLIILALGTPSFEDLSKAVLYKQASDVLEIALKKGVIRDGQNIDIERMRELMEAMELKGEVIIDGHVTTINNGKNNMDVYIERTLVTPELEYKRVVLHAWR
ncbi:MAG: hypothetical protein J7K68_03040 [Candidatus Diapherotrites archaeon]|nr:hypothetical protein [Candidatus Diapherotrites archaeon]